MPVVLLGEASAIQLSVASTGKAGIWWSKNFSSEERGGRTVCGVECAVERVEKGLWRLHARVQIGLSGHLAESMFLGHEGLSDLCEIGYREGFVYLMCELLVRDELLGCRWNPYGKSNNARTGWNRSPENKHNSEVAAEPRLSGFGSGLTESAARPVSEEKDEDFAK